MRPRINEKVLLRIRRKRRIRKKIFGTPERPRLSIFRSSYHITAQVIDDLSGQTLVAIHSYDQGKRANIGVCSELGKQLAAKCKEKSIGKVVFDKNGYQFHGRIKAVADGAREGGLDF